MAFRFASRLLPILFLVTTAAAAQTTASDKYVWPADTAVKARLQEWQDRKFGIILHWGLYAVPGIIESWNLCSEDWIERDSTIAYEDYKKWYWSLADSFNPVRFDPDSWAKAARGAGMRYMVFTTKHHDGFSLFDTKQSDFRITAGPFRNNPKADVARYVFDAFRREGFLIGAYFSKPDWHSQDYWWSRYATADRNNNYDIRKYPWRWNRFREFTYNQLRELMENYGAIDILWLDGGWVRPLETVNAEVRSWGARIPAWSQDVNIPRIAAMARAAQPGLLIVDRTVHGPYENYRTPEQHIPEGQLDHPWESCMTLANNWGYVPGDRYKSATKVIHTLAEVVAKGGNLLLGIGPKPDGTLATEATARLEEIGRWMQPNGAALYGTRTVRIYREGDTWFTRSKNGTLRYAIACLPEGSAVPQTVSWSRQLPRKGTRIILLQTGEAVDWMMEGSRVRVSIPSAIRQPGQPLPALAFAFTPAVPDPKK